MCLHSTGQVRRSFFSKVESGLMPDEDAGFTAAQYWAAIRKSKYHTE